MQEKILLKEKKKNQEEKRMNINVLKNRLNFKTKKTDYKSYSKMMTKNYLY